MDCADNTTKNLEPVKINNLKLIHHDKIHKHYLKDLLPRVPTDIKNLSEDSLYKYMLLNTSTSNTARIDFNKYGKRGYKLQAISNIFCDNIMLAAFVPKELTQKLEDCKFLKLKNSLVSDLRQKIQSFLRLNNIIVKDSEITPKRISPLDGHKNHFNPLDIQTIEKLYKKYRIEFNRDTAEAVGQYYKVELSSLQYNEVLKLFNTSNLFDLEEDFIRVADIDFTIDYKGSFSRELLKDYLINKLGFNMQQKQQTADDEDEFLEEGEYNGSDKTIINNAESVGLNCLTFLYGDTRYKIYNKFVQCIETKNNTQQTGTNLFNWINQPHERLRHSIEQSLDNGLTRLECTFYRNKYNNSIPPKEEIEKALNDLINLLPPDIIYSTPIAKQWDAYLECINNNVLIVDLHHNSLCLCYSINSITKRAVGITISTSVKNGKEAIDLSDYHYLLTYCTMDIPILVLFIDVGEEIIEKTTKKRCGEIVKNKIKEYYFNISYKYILTKPKEQTEKLTYIFKPRNLYYGLDSAKLQCGTTNQPTDRGLNDSEKVKLRIHANNFKPIIKAKKYNFDDKFYAFWVETPNIIFKKQPNKKQTEEQQNEQYFFEQHENTLNSITLYNKNTLNEYVKQQTIIDAEKTRINTLINLLHTKTAKPLNTLPENYKIVVIAIAPYFKYKDSYILVSQREEVLIATKNINGYISKCLENNSLSFNNDKLIILTDNNYIFNFTIERIFIKDNNTYAQTSRIIVNPHLQDIIDEQNNQNTTINKLRLENDLICGVVREKDCLKLESVEEGKELKITAIKLKEIGRKQKYIFYAEGYEKPFISNFFLEQTLKEYTPEHKFKILLGRLKTTPTKVKNIRTVFIK